ncbi:hypothetical protein B0H14DRAFT_2633219 [Mycena olivaceomarginata]|nr:hypothetical protein B0H14DRAFT_2633219 [Mycena olivaceomarginata]
MDGLGAITNEEARDNEGIGDHSAVFCVPPTRVCRDFTLYGLILDALVGRKNRKRSAFERGSNAFSDMLKLENAEPNLAFRFSNLLNLEPERAFGSVRFSTNAVSNASHNLHATSNASHVGASAFSHTHPLQFQFDEQQQRAKRGGGHGGDLGPSSNGRTGSGRTCVQKLPKCSERHRACLSGGTRLERIEVDTIELILVSRSNDALEIILLDLCSINQAGGR